MMLVNHDLPKDSGSYALLLALSNPQPLRVGRLGEFYLWPGHYIYLGSARGPGGIKARLGRHLRGGKNLHWHIDYLRAITDLTGFGYLLDRIDEPPSINVECTWSQSLAALPGVSIPMPGFGAGDCRAGCSAHLVALPDTLPSKENYRTMLADSVGRSPQEIIWVNKRP